MILVELVIRKTAFEIVCYNSFFRQNKKLHANCNLVFVEFYINISMAIKFIIVKLLVMNFSLQNYQRITGDKFLIKTLQIVDNAVKTILLNFFEELILKFRLEFLFKLKYTISFYMIFGRKLL